jgi:hypothetical protein
LLCGESTLAKSFGGSPRWPAKGACRGLRWQGLQSTSKAQAKAHLPYPSLLTSARRITAMPSPQCPAGASSRAISDTECASWRQNRLFLGKPSPRYRAKDITRCMPAASAAAVVAPLVPSSSAASAGLTSSQIKGVAYRGTFTVTSGATAATTPQVQSWSRSSRHCTYMC